MENRKTKVALSGATGFIGTRLAAYLRNRGYDVVPLGRDLFTDSNSEKLEQSVAGCAVVVNLAGLSIDHRWSTVYKQAIIESRVGVTRRLTEAVNRSPDVELFVSASAVGYYPTGGCYDESSREHGTGFLADLCRSWENEAHRVDSRVRLAVTRFGVVFAPQGGAFPRLSGPARWGASVTLGSGTQAFSWIDREDLIRAVEHLIVHPTLHGTFNFVAPGQMTQHELAARIGRHYRAWLPLRVPSAWLRMVFGEMAGMLTDGQCARPARLTESGFVFLSPDIDAFLARLDR